MSIRWALARHIADLDRGETRNMGVVLMVDGQVLGRFLGERNNRIDLRAVRGLGAGPAYRSWVEYWRRQILLGEGAVNEAIGSTRPGENYLLEAAGEMILGDVEDPKAFLNDLFARLVETEKPEPQDPVLETMERAARLLDYPLERDVDFEVPLKDDRVDHLQFDFRIDNRVPHLFRKVSIGRDSNSVHATAWSFRQILNARLPALSGLHCISLLRTNVDDMDASNLRVLEEFGQVLRANSPEADSVHIAEFIRTF